MNWKDKPLDRLLTLSRCFIKSRTPWHMLARMFCRKWINGHATESSRFLSPSQLSVEEPEPNIVAEISDGRVYKPATMRGEDCRPILTSGTKFLAR